MRQKTLIVITGPTASGKSALAIDVAMKLDTEIISADSRQIYRDIPISTAQPSREELAMVQHHLIGELALEDSFSAYEFEQRALNILDSIFLKKDNAIVCGGSMMYIDALCNGIDDLPTVSPEVRESVAEEYSTLGLQGMMEKLRCLDPRYAAVVDPNNVRRIVHAIEIMRISGKPLSSMLTGQKKKRPFRILKFGLIAPRELLFSRINNRVVVMKQRGLLSEAQSVYDLRHLNSLNTVGLKEMFAFIDGKMTFDDALARVAKNTRVYAKKQLNWFRRDKDMLWLDISNNHDLTGKILEEVRK